MRYNKRSKGFMLLGLILALVIIMILAGHYFMKDKEIQKTYVQTQLDKSSDAACAVNRQTLSTAIIAWTINHPGEQVTTEKLLQSGVNVVRCPDHVDYIFDNNGNVYCPIHFPLPNQTPIVPPSQARRAEQVIAPAEPIKGPALDRIKKQLGQ